MKADTRTSSPAGNIMLIVATIIWGAGFVAKTAGMDFVGPFTFNAARFFIGGTMALGPALFFLRRQRRGDLRSPDIPRDITKGTILAGFICGTVLTVAINLQQSALLFTSVANAGFITSLYVIMVPVVSLVFFKKKAPVAVWISVVIAMVGMYFLSLSGGMDINLGDILVFFCAMAFCAQILLIGHFSPRHNVMALACVQFYTVFALSMILALIFETPSFTDLFAAGPYVLYTGVLSSGVAYILQMKAQKTTDSTIAAILFSFEAVVATLAGWLMLSQFLTPRELLGCALIFVAILAAQVPVGRKKAKVPR